MAFPGSRFGVIACALGAVVIAGVASVWQSPGGSGDSRAGRHIGREGVPPAVARRMERLERSLPGNEGEGLRGPGSYDEQRWTARTYPADEIPLELIVGAREAFGSIRARGVGSGKSTPGAWFHMGPTSATYQTSFYRFSYVPRQYESSGRVTAMAIAPTCIPGNCRIWVAAAGGGIWRTDNALAGSPQWRFISGSFGINAIGTIQVDPTDPTGNTIWVGTGEPNASGDSAAGVGLYKSLDGGDTWSAVMGAGYFSGRAIGAIAIHPGDGNILYVASARGVRGVASTGGGTTNIPGAMPYGLWKSTDGGATFTFVHNGAPLASTCYPVIGAACSVRGVRRVALDPVNPEIVYAASYGRGVWRSNDAGATWSQIKPSLGPSTDSSMRPEIAVTRLPNGDTRMYVGEGGSGSPYSRLFRSDSVATGAPVFTDLTSNDPANPGFGSYDYCGSQCWYDSLVYTPPGYPDIVYVGGSYQYSEPARISHGRALVLSTDAGVTFTDMTKDATGNLYQNGLHPDQHALVTNPNNPFQFFNGSDGGVMRSNGKFADESYQCDWRPLSAVRMARCRQLLSRVPARLEGMNRGLATLQFQSLSVDPSNPQHVQGGTQDNGTFQTSGSPTYWAQTMWGDGGQSGFDVAINGFRFHTFYAPSPDVNFSSGAIHDWNWIADRIYTSEPALFYPPMISDPVMSRWLWIGTGHVWRTKTHGMGPRPLQEFRARCNEFSGDFTIYCGDWEPLGAQGYNTSEIPPDPWNWPPAPNATTRLTSALWGPDRTGGWVSRVARAADSHTLWASTSTGRLFISKNADADPASTVTFTRLDSLATNDPNRFISGIFVDPGNPNRVFVSYSGFSAVTPTVPGHVFEVVYDPSTGGVVWTSLDGSGSTGIPDLPVNDVVLDTVTGDLYASTDFGVLRSAGGGTTWTLAAVGMPNAEVSALTIAPAARRLYAATHGLGAWSLALP